MPGNHEEDDGLRIGEKDLPKKFVLKILGHCETSGLWGIKHTREPVDKMVRFAKEHKLCLPMVRLIVTREGVFLLPLDFGRKRREERGNDSEMKIDVTVPKSEIRVSSPPGDDEDPRKVATGKHCFRIKAHFRIIKRVDGGRTRTTKKKKKDDDATVPERSTSDGSEPVCAGCGKERTAHHSEPVRMLTDVRLLEKYKNFDWNRHGIAFYPIDNISYGVQDLIYTRVFSMIEVPDAANRFDSARKPFVCHSFVCESHNAAKTLTCSLDAAFQAYGRILKGMRSSQ